MKNSFTNQHLSRCGGGGARGVNKRSTKKAIGEAVVKWWKDNWLDIIGPYFWNINISFFIVAGHKTGMTRRGLDVILENNSAMCVDESW